MSRASQPTRLPQDVYEAAVAAARSASRTVPQQIAYWARIGRELERSPQVSQGTITRVLNGVKSYDEINPQEQAVVREKWDERATKLRGELDYAERFSTAGETYSELDDAGRIKTSRPD